MNLLSKCVSEIKTIGFNNSLPNCQQYEAPVACKWGLIRKSILSLLTDTYSCSQDTSPTMTLTPIVLVRMHDIYTPNCKAILDNPMPPKHEQSLETWCLNQWSQIIWTSWPNLYLKGWDVKPKWTWNEVGLCLRPTGMISLSLLRIIFNISCDLTLQSIIHHSFVCVRRLY